MATGSMDGAWRVITGHGAAAWGHIFEYELARSKRTSSFQDSFVLSVPGNKGDAMKSWRFCASAHLEVARVPVHDGALMRPILEYTCRAPPHIHPEP